jgi:putative transposase
MAIKRTHDNEAQYYFCTFTCYQWLPLIEQTNSYAAVYKWFDYLRKKQVEVAAYVIMPNHVHVLLYFARPCYSLNTIISNAKRFLAYAIIKRLQAGNDIATLQLLQQGLTLRERRKGQKHKVFEESFDAKAIYTEAFFKQKLEYIHFNPVRGKWQLVADYTTYEHSSAAFYETGMWNGFQPFDYRVLEGEPLATQAGSRHAAGPSGEDPA